MEIEKFVNQFAAQFEATDPESFNATTSFKNVEEWDSLIALAVIAMTDEEYGVQLTGEDIRNAVTIADVFEMVKAKKG